MKLKNDFIIFCLCIVFIGCNSKEIDELENQKNSLEKNNNELNVQIDKLTDSLKQLEAENHKLNHAIEQKNQYGSPDFEYEFELRIFIESIFKEFHYEPPVLINLTDVRTNDFDISGLSKEEKEFYDKYVGSYIYTGRLKKDYLTSHILEFYIREIENGIVFCGFEKSMNSIYYDNNEKKFYEADSFSCFPINDISNYRCPYPPSQYTKITNLEFIEDILNSINTNDKINSKPLTQIEENKIRELLIGFYSLLGQKRFNELIDIYFDYDSDKTPFIDELLSDYTFLSYQNIPFDIYINTFFNADINNYDKDTILVEFKYPSSIEYVRFGIKKVGNKYIIDSYTAIYNEE